VLCSFAFLLSHGAQLQHLGVESVFVFSGHSLCRWPPPQHKYGGGCLLAAGPDMAKILLRAIHNTGPLRAFPHISRCASGKVLNDTEYIIYLLHYRNCFWLFIHDGMTFSDASFYV
jgi:hypothetical protein